eukprot:scaffold58267_cov63-Attheya_sp.AAC.1
MEMRKEKRVTGHTTIWFCSWKTALIYLPLHLETHMTMSSYLTTLVDMTECEKMPFIFTA